MQLIALSVFAVVALAMPVQLSAQQTRYKLTDLGTPGGPASYVNSNTDALNNRGTWWDLQSPAPDCFSLKRTRLPPHYPSSGWLAEEFITQPNTRVDAAVPIRYPGWLTSITRLFHLAHTTF
jgi:hypothetical protein